jgi:hypothetical protein
MRPAVAQHHAILRHAGLALAEGRPTQAAHLLSASGGLLQRMEIQRFPAFRLEYERWRIRLRKYRRFWKNKVNIWPSSTGLTVDSIGQTQESPVPDRSSSFWEAAFSSG